MPSLQKPLRQYSSAQAMRYQDGLRQHAPQDRPLAGARPTGSAEGAQSAQATKFDKVLPPMVGAPSHYMSTRRPLSPNGHDNQRGRMHDSASASDPQRRAKNLPESHQAENMSSVRHRVDQPPNNMHVSRSLSPASAVSSNDAYDTRATSIELPPLQARSALDNLGDAMEPLYGDLTGSFDLVAPPNVGHDVFSLERRSEQLFSQEHLQVIFSSPSSLLKFTAFLSTHRPQSVPMLIYYLDALKALKAIKYANAIAEALSPIRNHDFTKGLAHSTVNHELNDKAAQAFAVLTEEDLPAFVTQMYIQVVSQSISQRITGTLAPHLREASEGLAEVFCLTDPSRPDNPIVFASEEFHRTTQYGMNHAIGRNCRFLQGPRTNPRSPRRLGDAVRSGVEHCEVFLNYRRDGSPFMNMLMIAPLCDSRGKIRYFIGAQVDVSGLVKDCVDMESLQQLIDQGQSNHTEGRSLDHLNKDDFQDLSEMLNMAELETVRRHGGRMHREYQDEERDSRQVPNMPRLLLQEPNSAGDGTSINQIDRQSGRLSGIYQNYLLIRPYPSFRILFASPTLRVPGILQSPFMDKIGGSSRVRNELSAALSEGRGVTAKVRWVSKADIDGRSRWIHCTPLLGSNSQIGVWMIVLVDDDQVISGRRWKQAPPVAPHRDNTYESSRDSHEHIENNIQSHDRASPYGVADNGAGSQVNPHQPEHGARPQANSPNSVLI